MAADVIPLPGGHRVVVSVAAHDGVGQVGDIHFGEGTEDEMCINWIRYWPKGGFSCTRMAPPDGSQTVDDPNSNGNGVFPTGDDDAGVAPPPSGP